MTIAQLQLDYKNIAVLLNERWPIEDKDKRIFARTMKIVEEFGEMVDEILTSMNLQRNSKIDNYSPTNLEDELADVLGSLILLAGELDIDVEEVIKRKIELTNKRFQ